MPSSYRQSRQNLLRPKPLLLAAFMLILVITGLIILGNSRAAGNTYYAAPNGSDTNPGTVAAPWRTLQKGMVSLRPGDTLQLRAGTYAPVSNPGITKGTPTARIRVTSYPGERAKIQGLVRIAHADYWTFDHLDFTWRDGDPYNQHMLRLTNGVGWILEHNNIYGAKSYANLHITSWQNDAEPRDAIIRRNRIHDVPYVPETLVNRQHNIYTGGTPKGSLLIERNLLYNSPNGDNLKIGGGESSENTYNVTARYNTMYNASSSITLMGGAYNHQIYRNILYKSGPRHAITLWEVRNSGSKVYENFYGASPGFMQEQGNTPAGTAASLTGSGNIQGDPKFTSPGAGDFHTGNPTAADYGYYAGASAPTAPGVRGDLNGDRNVSITDLSILLSNWGKDGPSDLNSDGKTDIRDLSILLSSWTS